LDVVNVVKMVERGGVWINCVWEKRVKVGFGVYSSKLYSYAIAWNTTFYLEVFADRDMRSWNG
jgi:hypothetical protein